MRITPPSLVLLFVAGCANEPANTHFDLLVPAESAPDLASPSDLGPAADLRPPAPDLAPPDLAHPDLAHPDTCATHDLAGATCDQLALYTKEWIACHQACDTDGDCVKLLVHANSLCKNACPVITNGSAPGVYLTALTGTYNLMKCGKAGCSCFDPGIPGCKSQLCGSK